MSQQPTKGAAEPAWRTVPVKPTEEMEQAGRYVHETSGWNSAPAIYKAMLDAAPARQPEPTAPGGELSDDDLARIAYEGFDSYWTEDCKGSDQEAWAASAKAILAAAKEK